MKRVIPRSKTSRGFGASRAGHRLHCGTDIAAPNGADVVSIQDGIVGAVFLFTYPGLDRYHRYEKTYAVAVRHSDGNYALYAEVQKPKLRIGKRVKAGQKIAKIGRIFHDRPEHTMLHFEYHAMLPKSITKWFVGKKPKGLLNSTKYLKRTIQGRGAGR